MTNQCVLFVVPEALVWMAAGGLLVLALFALLTMTKRRYG